MADLLRGDHAHVNLIPMNPVAHTPWTGQPDAGHRDGSPRPSATAGIGTTIRRNRGQEVGAACGQLAAERAGRAAGARRRAAPRTARVAESAAALRGERSHEPVAGRGGGVAWAAGGRAIAASILDADFAQPRLRRPPGRRRRAPTGSTSTSWTATSSRT